MKLLLTLIALAAVFWSASFVRAAVRTFRFGTPFTLTGHHDGAAPVEARFGRVGAVLLTGVSIAVAFMMVQIAIAAWME